MTTLDVRRDAASEKFFDGTARGELLIRHCTACGAHAAPQFDACPACKEPTAAWVPADGTGTVISWTVVHGRPRDDAPAPQQVVAFIELTEGPWLYAALNGLRAGERPWPGMSVTVAFEHPEGGEAIPVFLPTA
jgi:uncharacterized OB-fold protein